MKLLTALIFAALLTTGCGAATAGGGEPGSSRASTAPDGVVSHDVDPNEPAPPGTGALVKPVQGDSRGTPVLPVKLRVGSGDGRAWARVTWWGGVPECYVLRPVRIARHGTALRLSLFEASGVPAATACIDLAMEKAVRVDLGALDPGTYTVRAGSLVRTLVVA
jgi:hypothetical protein